MTNLRLTPVSRGLHILCIGAHADDIEIGCAGTLLTLIAARRVAAVTWVVLSGGGTPRAAEARSGARRCLRNVRRRQVIVAGFRDGFFPAEYGALKDYVETLQSTEPDLVLTHQLEEHHQDHRLVAQLTWNTFRDHMILEYEIPKYDGFLGAPNVFVPLTPAIRRRKIEILMGAYHSQRSKRWFTASTFEGLMRLRGVEAGAPEGHAEAFVGRKLLIGR